jgi:hypothetical protein
MFSVFELVEGVDYDRIPSKSSKTHCIFAARQCISKKSDEVPDLIFAYECKASEEDVETAVFVKTGLRTPWIKDSFSTFMENYEKRVGIVTWELVPEAGRSIAEKEKCLKAALEYLEFKKIEVVRSFSFSFQAIDPNDDLIDDEEMSDHIYLDTGLKSEWYPHRVSDSEENAELSVNAELLNEELSVNEELSTNAELSNAEISVNAELSTNAEILNVELPVNEERVKPRIGRPPKPIICPDCNMVFKNSNDKNNHRQRGKCVANKNALKR